VKPQGETWCKVEVNPSEGIITFDQKKADGRIFSGEFLADEELRTELQFALRDEHLAAIGMERLEITVSQLQKGDVLPDLGITVLSSNRMKLHNGAYYEIDTNSPGDAHVIILRGDQLIRINRSAV
jgi:hypothetical protein